MRVEVIRALGPSAAEIGQVTLELLRPLSIDPKQARRRRAQAQREKTP